MPKIGENRILNAQANAENYTVVLTWASGRKTVSDFSELVGIGICTPFRDPEFFKQVSPRNNGRELAWTPMIAFDADALWFQAHPEDAHAPKVPQIRSRPLNNGAKVSRGPT